jgi:peptidoglycan/LPS O-acetylase OafA/YrhL
LEFFVLSNDYQHNNLVESNNTALGKLLGGGHVRELDGVRGIAIVLVMLHHFSQAVKLDGLAGRIFSNIADSGWIGVDLFFVLSGFLITGILLDSRKSNNYFKAFYMRRVLRIFPLYYAVVIGLLYVLPAISQSFASEVKGDKIWYLLYGSNILTAMKGWPTRPLQHLWSLAIEEQFYLVWPFLIFVFRKRTLYIALVVLIAVAIGSRLFFYQNYGRVAAYILTPCRLDSLVFGSMLALLLRDNKAKILERYSAIFMAGIAGLVILILGFGIEWRNWGVPGQMFAYVGLAIISMGSISLSFNSKESIFKKVYRLKFLRTLGKYSYGIYVFHLILDGIVRQSGYHPATLGEGEHKLLFTVLYNILMMVLSFVVAFMSWHLFEKHFLKLKKRFAYQRCNTGSNQEK